MPATNIRANTDGSQGALEASVVGPLFTLTSPPVILFVLAAWTQSGYQGTAMVPVRDAVDQDKFAAERGLAVPEQEEYVPVEFAREHVKQMQAQSRLLIYVRYPLSLTSDINHRVEDTHNPRFQPISGSDGRDAGRTG